MTHNNPHYTDRTAVAPYNFVPPPEKVLTVEPPAPQDEYTGHSGWFECELETSSPTFIRGMVTEAEYQNKVEAKDKPAFFSLDGQAPLIPGSSLRGLFRLLVEVVAHARLSQVTDQPQVFRSVDTTSHGADYRQRLIKETRDSRTGTIYLDPRVQAGYMWREGDRWYIQPAQKIDDTTFARIDIESLLGPIEDQLQEWYPDCRQARKIYIQPGKHEYHPVKGGHWQLRYSKVEQAKPTNAPGFVEGVLAKSGPMDKKKLEAVVFMPDTAIPKEQWIAIEPLQIRRYRNQLTGNPKKERKTQAEEKAAKNTQRQLLGDEGVLVDGHPVFYLMNEEGKLVFFGHTLMMRLPYTQAPSGLLENVWPEATGQLDLAEALFGYVSHGQTRPTEALAGRVFFSDAHWQPGVEADPYEREITPKVLSGPKPTTFQHYVEQPNPDDRLRLKNYDAQGARLRGHKFYWQKGAVKVEQVEETDREKLKHPSQYTRIRPLKAGQKFTFTIRFDNLNAEELGALAWVLQLAADPAYRLKLGMGKPLGMGAVRVRACLKLLNRRARYASLWAKDSTCWGTGELSAEETEATRQDVLRAFEDKVLTVCPSANTLNAAPRIQHLLKLLEWPGPDLEFTRYLEIERRIPDALWEKRDYERDHGKGKRNEYRERPVLPDPLNVGIPPKGLKAPAPQPLEEAVEVEGQPSPTQPRSRQRPDFVSPNEAARQVADSTLATMAARAAENEAKEERKRQEKAERKKRKR